jgi:hypothetical protein
MTVECEVEKLYAVPVVGRVARQYPRPEAVRLYLRLRVLGVSFDAANSAACLCQAAVAMEEDALFKRHLTAAQEAVAADPGALLQSLVAVLPQSVGLVTMAVSEPARARDLAAGVTAAGAVVQVAATLMARGRLKRRRSPLAWLRGRVSRRCSPRDVVERREGAAGVPSSSPGVFTSSRVE